MVHKAAPHQRYYVATYAVSTAVMSSYTFYEIEKRNETRENENEGDKSKEKKKETKREKK